MDIIALTRDKELIQTLKTVAKNINFKLNVISELENFSDIFVNTLTSKESTLHTITNFQVVIIDKDFFSALQELNKKHFNNCFYNYPFLLILDDYSKENSTFAATAEIFSFIIKDAPIEEYKLRIETLVKSFNYICQMHDWAFKDMLTDLNNRRTFLNLLEIYYNTFIQYQIPFCLAILDIDFFKRINDTYGHPKGDEFLLELSRIMKSNTRKTDTISRIGGEEFAIIFPDTSLNAAHKVIKRVTKNIALFKNKDSIHTTVSVGLAQVKPQYTTMDKFLIEVDNLLYKAKETGRNRICL